MKQYKTDIVYKIFALLMPVYFVFYAPLHQHPENPRSKSLWKYTITGFIIYGLIISYLFLR